MKTVHVMAIVFIKEGREGFVTTQTVDIVLRNSALSSFFVNKRTVSLSIQRGTKTDAKLQ